jgi:hypothetical protein
MTRPGRWAFGAAGGVMLCFVFATGAGAIARDDDSIPEPLRPWVDWVLHGHEERLCPFLNGFPDQRPCAWPSRVTLLAEDAYGGFAQDWLVLREAWVPLPGDVKIWPQEVKVGGTFAPVVERDGRPMVRLSAGSHGVTGLFAWDRLPETLAVPPATGLLALTVRGERVPFPERDADGRVRLAGRTPVKTVEEDRLDVIVTRHFADGVPMFLTTRVDLRVSGTEREVLLARALPESFIPTALTSPLPARVEPDDRLRIQLRPGRWIVTLAARSRADLESLTLPEPDGPWGGEEAWAFQADSSVRLVEVEGVVAVDPQQTELPDEWKALPAYRMRPGDTMKLAVKRRGDADPAPDQLALERRLWLDFDGGGWTFHDRISGTMSRSWRLEMAPPGRLGRVAVGGEDQFITRLEGSAGDGVEIRRRPLDLDADGRLDGHLDTIPAVGWNHDFQSVSAELNLPPGWRLLHATGVDRAEPTWVTRWTLLDLFIVLITALATLRLWGLIGGALALIALTLSYVEPGAPRYVWLFVLGAEALARVLPHGRFLSFARVFRLAAIAVLVTVTVPFVVQQVRQGLYPALERTEPSRAAFPVPAAPPIEDYGADEVRSKLRKAAPALAVREATPLRRDIDPDAVVQTGPGLPTWQQSVVSLAWRGPVEKAQEVRLLLVTPEINLGLSVGRTLLLALLVLYVIGAARRRPERGSAASPAIVLLASSLAALLAGTPAFADLPPAEMLDQLRQRLLEPPDCHPDCASINRMRLEVEPGALRARLQVDVAADSAVPLPGSREHWSPDTVLAGDGDVPGLFRGQEGWLWVRLTPGRHEILLSGALPDLDVVQILLPRRPRRVEASVTGWRLEGVHENGIADESLVLTRIREEAAGEQPRLDPGTLPPFVRVERSLSLGLTWQVETSLLRLTPAGSAIVLDLPLLPGESVTTAGVRVQGGKVALNMPPEARRIVWQSVLEPRQRIDLRAADATAWTEVWRLDAGALWHVETSGIAPVHAPLDTGTARVREWRPWPGESVDIAVSRPAGVPGQTLTIDHSRLEVQPGIRATDASLALDLRSSRGGQHTIRLPEAARLQAVTIDGATQPIGQEGRNVTVPLVPGSRSVRIAWRQQGGIARSFASPRLDLGAPSVNAEIHLAVPADRWVLYTLGPRLGPAVLFWSLLAVLLLASIALGRVRLTPLRSRHWFLLAVGLSQVPIWVAVMVAGWLLALGWRREHGAALGNPPFNLLQILLIGWTAAALAGLVFSIEQGLLGLPDMQVAGNGSSAYDLRWYQDAAPPLLPQATVFSVPLLAYRLAMLAWALWLAQALLGWLRWGWDSFRTGGLWQPMWRRGTKTA